MASITMQIPIAADADTVWAAVRDVGHPHHLFAAASSPTPTSTATPASSPSPTA